MAKRGRAKAAMSTLNPKIEMIHAVTVVPILAPIITLMDSANVSRPAFYKTDHHHRRCRRRLDKGGDQHTC